LGLIIWTTVKDTVTDSFTMQLLLKIESSISIGQNSADFPGAVGANAPIGKGSVGACTQRKNWWIFTRATLC